VSEPYEGEKPEERELDLFMLQAEAVESRCRNASDAGVVEELSREEMCPPNKLRVGILGLCFKSSFVKLSRLRLTSCASHTKP